jgi:hypothetical protein
MNETCELVAQVQVARAARLSAKQASQQQFDDIGDDVA